MHTVCPYFRFISSEVIASQYFYLHKELQAPSYQPANW